VIGKGVSNWINPLYMRWFVRYCVQIKNVI